MPKMQIKCDTIHFRCESELKKQIQDYVDTYNEKYGQFGKTNTTEIIEIAVTEYIRKNCDIIPFIDRGQELW